MIEERRAKDANNFRIRSLRRWFFSFALLVVTVGGLLLVVGSLMPAYTDPVAADRIWSGLECERGVPNTNEDQRCPDELWHRSMNSLRTDKWSFVDVGAGLLVSGLSMCVFLWWSRKRSWKELLTPKRSLSIIALAGLAWLLQIPAYDAYFMAELARGYYPHWADSISIPMMQFESILLWLFLPYVGIWLVFVVGAELPAPVFSSVSGRPLVNAFWTGLTTLLLLPIILVLFGVILDGPILMVPLLWLTVWLLLCARAAALTRHRPALPQ